MAGGSAGLGDTCAAALPLVFDGGVATIAFDLNLFTHQYSPSCSPNTGRDAVFVLSLSEPSDLTITGTDLSGFGAPILSLEGTPCQGATPLDAGSAPTCIPPFGLTTQLTVPRLPAGTYFLFYDQTFLSSSARPQRLTVGRSPAAINETCREATALFPDGGLGALHVGTTAQQRNDVSAPCASSPGHDAFFWFEASAGQRLTASLVSSAFQPALFVLPLSSCLPDAGLGHDGGVSVAACTTGRERSDPAMLDLPSLQSGRYLLVVDSTGSQLSNGSYRLTAQLSSTPATQTNTTCSSATPLTLGPGPAAGTSFRARVTGSTLGAPNTHVESCFGPTVGSDVVYSFTTPAMGGPDGGLEARLQLVSLHPQRFTPELILQRTCGATTGLIDCGRFSFLAPNDDAQLILAGLAPATSYSVWVDSTESQSPAGPFELRVDVASPPTNDTCANPQPLPLDVSVEGSTLGARGDLNRNNAYVGCSGSNLPGPEVLYQVTAPRAGTLRVQLTPERNTDLSLVLLSSCGPASDGGWVGACTRSVSGVVSRPLEATTVVSAGATVLISVDSSGFSPMLERGGFVLSATIE